MDVQNNTQQSELHNGLTQMGYQITRSETPAVKPLVNDEKSIDELTGD